MGAKGPGKIKTTHGRGRLTWGFRNSSRKQPAGPNISGSLGHPKASSLGCAVAVGTCMMVGQFLRNLEQHQQGQNWAELYGYIEDNELDKFRDNWAYDAANLHDNYQEASSVRATARILNAGERVIKIRRLLSPSESSAKKSLSDAKAERYKQRMQRARAVKNKGNGAPSGSLRPGRS